jgi:hypothetical protein
MGATESHSSLDEKYYGFRVYKVAENGPLAKAGVRELEYFIIPPSEVFSNRVPFYEYVRQNANKQITLNIYSLARRYFYNLDIIPTDDWTPSKDQGYLGASVRYENWSTADRLLLRVLRVNENSIAHKKLNLTPQEDFIIALRPDGEDIITLNKDSLDPLTMFTNILNLYKNKPIEFFIYNCKRGGRNVKITIDEESLGCDVAYGKLHEFPKLVEISNESNPRMAVTKIEHLDGELVSQSHHSNSHTLNKNNLEDKKNLGKISEEDDIQITDEKEKN